MIKIIGIAIIATSVIIGIASRFIFKKSDNVVEEIAEEIIKKKTGYDVDLSPDTPEEPEKKEADGKDKCGK